MVSGEKTVTKQTQTDVHSVLTSVKGEWRSSNAGKIATEEEMSTEIGATDTRNGVRKDSSKASKNAAAKKDVADVKIFALIAESVA